MKEIKMKFLHTILIPALALSATTVAQAHAFLDHALPKVGSTVRSSPDSVKIWFTEELEPAFSKIRVYDSAQREVDRHDLKIDPSSQSLMTVSVPRLPPGTYEVIWDAVAVDTHHTHGTFKFEIASP